MTNAKGNDYEKQLQRTYEQYMRDEISVEDIPPGMFVAIKKKLEKELRANKKLVNDMKNFLCKAKEAILKENKKPEESFEEPFKPEKFMKEFRTAIETEAVNNGNIEIESGIKKVAKEDMAAFLETAETVDTTEAFNMTLFDE